MATYDLPDIPISAWESYVADRFKNLTQPVINAFGQQRDPAIQAIYDRVDPANRMYVDQAVGAAQRTGINPVLYVKQIQQESGFNPTAGSGEGAKGIAQFTDQTAKGFGIDPYNPSQALDAGARYMASSLAQNGGDYRLALAAYNAGQGNVNRYGQRIFDPAYLQSQGWSAQDANQPAQYIQSILGGANAPAPSLTTSPPLGTVNGNYPHPALPAAGPPRPALSFKDFSEGLLHQFSQQVGLGNGGQQLGDVGRTNAANDGGLGTTEQANSLPSPADGASGLTSGSEQGSANLPFTSQLSTINRAPSGYNDMAGASSSPAAAPATPTQPPAYNDMVGANSNAPQLGAPQGLSADVGVPPGPPAPSFADWSGKLIDQFGQTVGTAANQVGTAAHNEVVREAQSPDLSAPGTLIAKGVLGLGDIAAANRAEQERAYALPPGPEREAAMSQLALNAVMSMGGAGELGNATEQVAGKAAAPLAEEAGRAIGGAVRDVRGTLGQPPQTVTEALTAAKNGWTQVSQIAKDLHFDTSSHETFLPMEIETMSHAPGTVQAAQREIELYNEYTSNVVGQVLKQMRPQIEQLTTAIAGQKEAAYPELTRIAKGLLNDNGTLKEAVPLRQWQNVTGDTRTLAPNALVKQRGKVYVKPEYALDDVYNGDEAAQKFGKSFDNLGDFQQALYQALQRDQGVKGQVAQLQDLTAKEKALETAYHAGLPSASLHDDVTGAAAGTVRPVEVPLQGAQSTLNGAPPMSTNGTIPLTPPRALQRLEEARGTPEQQAQLRPVADDHAANLLLTNFPADQRAALQPLADTYGQFAGQRRGVQSDAVATANAQRGLGMSVADFLKSPPGRAFNNEQIIALGNTAVHYQDQVTALSRGLESARAAGTNTPQMEADLLTKSLEANALISVLSGGTAEAGRALRAVRTILTGEYAVSAKASGLAAKRFGVDPTELARQVGPSEAPSVGGAARSPQEAGFSLQGTPAPIPMDAGQVGLQREIPGLANLAPGRPMTAAEMTALKDSGAAGIQPELLAQLENGKELTAADIQQIRDSAKLNSQGDLSLDAAATGGGSHEQRLTAAYKALGTNGQAFKDWMTAWNLTKPEDTVGRYKLLQSLTKPSFMDKALTFGISNMLSSTKTGEIIGMHGAIMALNRPLLTVIRGDPLDAVANVVGQTRSIGTAWSNAVEALNTGVGPTTASATLRGGNLDVRPDAFPGTTGLIVTPTLRVINMMHEFFRTTATAGALSEAARRETLMTGRTIDDLLAHPTDKMLKFADDIAEQALHGGTPSTPAQLILRARNLVHTDISGANFNAQNVGKVATGLTANLLLPFVKIPDYLYRNGAKIATGPLYYGATTAAHLARGETSQAISDARMWGVVSLLWGGILGEAIAGNVTGSGPSDPSKLALLKEARDPQTGQPAWQAHSTRIPGPGGYRWVDNNVFGPLAIPLNALASAVETYRLEGIKPTATPTDFMINVANNTAKSLLDASYIRTAGQFFSAAMQGQAASAIAKTTGTNIVGRFIPFEGAAAEVARGLDSGVKAPAGPLQQIEARLPLLSHNVPNEVSPYGQPLQNRQDITSTLSPAITSTSGTVNLAANEVARLNQAGQAVNVRVFPPSQQKAGGAYQGSPQSAEQIRTLQSALGQNAQRYIDQEMSRPAYQNLSDADKAKALNRALGTADQQANLGVSSSINQTDRQKALTAWAQIPHFAGVTGTSAQIADKNLQIEKAKADLTAYTKKYGSREMGMYHLMRDNRAAFDLTLRQPVSAAYLKYRQQQIDKQYGGALSQALSQGVIDANQVLPVGSGG